MLEKTLTLFFLIHIIRKNVIDTKVRNVFSFVFDVAKYVFRFLYFVFVKRMFQ